MGQGGLGSTPSSTVAELDPVPAGGKEVCLTVRSLTGSEDWTVRIALPAYMGRTNAEIVLVEFARGRSQLTVFAFY